jgi:hypothetical protein
MWVVRYPISAFFMSKICEIVKDLMNFEKWVYESFLFSEYKSFLRIQGLTLDTQKFYLEYIYRFIKYSKFESISDFDSILKLKVGYNNLANKWITNNTINKYYLSIVKYSYFLLDNELIQKNVILNYKK